MKKVYKIFLFIAVGLMGLGVTIGGGALIASGFDTDKFLITEKNFTSFRYDRAETVKTLCIDDVDDAVAVDRVSIVPSPDNDFHACYYGRSEDDIVFDYNAEECVLTVKAREHNKDWRTGIGIYNVGDMPMEIQVPVSVESLEISSSVVDLSCSGLTLNGYFSCESDTGELTLKNLTVRGNADISADIGNVLLENIQGTLLEISSDSGDVQLDSVTAQIMEIDTDLGDVAFSGLNVEKELSLETDSGDMKGTLEGSRDDFTAEVKTEMSDCNVDNGGIGAKRLRINAEIGDVYITFLK